LHCLFHVETIFNQCLGFVSQESFPNILFLPNMCKFKTPLDESASLLIAAFASHLQIAHFPPNPFIINLPIFCVSLFVIFGTCCTFTSVPVFLINCTFHVSRIHRMANGVIKGGIEAVSTYVTHQFGNLSGPMTCCSCRVSLQAKTLCIIGALLQVACTSTT
jgi:hypothetical protein